VVDQHGATLLAMGVLAGLTRKLLTGKGTRVESNLLNAGIDLHVESLVNYFSGHYGPDRFLWDPHLATWFHEAPYGIYQLADARIVLSSNDPTNLARAIGSEELAALATVDRYAERDLYVVTVAKLLAERTLASITATFEAEGIWWAPVSSFEQLRDDPRLKHNDVFRTVSVGNSWVTLVNHPIRYDGRRRR
jgi:crotonobetainyl-CoA:carnitine CoA-transferase CaiB-like acyl-CoA transferase